MIDQTEFSKLEFNPTIKKPLTQAYPKLKQLVGEVDDKMMRYVILMYDQNSPLRHHYPELHKRKEFAADLAGYDGDVVQLFEFKLEDGPYEELIELVMKYLKYQNNWVWSMIVSNENAFYEFNKRVMLPVDGTKDKDILQAINIKTQVMAAQDDIVTRLKKYLRELSGEDEELQDVIIKRKRLRPEEIASVQENR